MLMSHEGVLKKTKMCRVTFSVRAYIRSSIFLQELTYRNILADIEAIGRFRVTIYRKERRCTSSEHENIVTYLDE